METARFVLTPFYESIDTIIPLTKLRLTNLMPDIKPGRFIGNQLLEFSLQLDHSFLLSESKKHKSNKFDIRAIIRFSNIDDVHKVDDQFTLKDNFPIHLKLNLNNTLITLPQFLPNDRTGKDGRRFPRPIDLSEGLLDNPLVINKFLIHWIQDDCKKESFYYAVYLVRRRTCEELSQILLKKQISPIQKTMNFIVEHSNNHNTGQDDDLMLVDNTINTSLICPVSRVRMSTPVRGQQCTHLQCFDCVTYLIMNFNKPTWQCPVCDKKTFFCYLEVDSLILGILNDSRSKSVDGVIFNKIGQWKLDNKAPGVANDDDSSYNDISNYPNATDDNDPIKSNLTLRSEPFKEFNEEKYLQHILQNSNRMSLLTRFRHPNPINNMFPTMPKVTGPNCVPIMNPLFPDSINRNVFNSHSNQQPHSLFNTAGAFQDNIRHISSVASSMNLNHNQSNMPMRFKIGLKTSDQLSNYLNNNRTNQLPNQKSKLNSYLGDTNPQIKITNVTSMAKNRNESNVIVISDDENDDVLPSSSDKGPTIKVFTRAHKRPTAVSSVPSTVGSAKSQKLSDIYGSQIPMRAYAASAPSVLNSQRIECCCTSNNMCAPHREILLRNRIAMNNESGIVRESNQLKLHDLVDLTQTNLQMDNYQKSIRSINGNAPHLNNANNNNASYEQQATMKINLSKIHNPQDVELTHQNRSTVKEYLKSLQNPAEKTCNDNNNNANRMRNLLNTQFTIQHRPVEPAACQMSPEYVHQQWINMMMSSSQQYPVPQNLLHTSPQFLQNNSVPQKNLNSLVNQSNAFFNC